jgi:large subunit ribosomal protein L1
MKKSKAQQDADRRYDTNALYSPRDAIDLVKTFARASFDESVDASFLLGIDARQADQLVRGTVSLPHGTGKEVRVAVFAESDKAREAEAAGADIVGGKDLADELQGGGALNFDIAIATPDMMPVVGKLGPILGPRGLMPNPKSGTVTQDVGKTVEAFKAGRVEYRNDRYGNVHVPIGRVSFTEDQLEQNLAAVSDEITRSRPPAVKGRFMKKLALSSTMGPGVWVDPAQVEDLVKEHR